MRFISSPCDLRKSLLPALLSLLPSFTLKSPKKIKLYFQVIFLFIIFLIFHINIYLSMYRSFIVSEGTYKAKIASAVFLILNKPYLPAGPVIYCSIGGAILFVSTKTSQVCVFLVEIMTSLS